AERYLKRLQPRSQERILNELDKLLASPTQTDFKKLQGRESYRLRVGDYRVLMQVNREERLFIVTEIGPRGDIYK
ncbi:MAG: type II toxin-antitoxin system RelE family toxin, partial [Microcystis sp.]